MRLVCAWLVFFTVCIAGCGSPSTTATGTQAKTGANDSQALAQLKGTWQVTAIVAAGKPVPSDRVQKIGLQYVFDGDKVTVRRPDRPDNNSTVTIDESASPKRMTINQSPPIHAVYAVEGDKLQLCLMVDDNPNAGFPSELASKASPKTDLLTLERR
jgi:uncharacterized protein (TIGR03067 family)